MSCKRLFVYRRKLYKKKKKICSSWLFSFLFFNFLKFFDDERIDWSHRSGNHGTLSVSVRFLLFFFAHHSFFFGKKNFRQCYERPFLNCSQKSQKPLPFQGHLVNCASVPSRLMELREFVPKQTRVCARTSRQTQPPPRIDGADRAAPKAHCHGPRRLCGSHIYAGRRKCRTAAHAPLLLV